MAKHIRIVKDDEPEAANKTLDYFEALEDVAESAAHARRALRELRKHGGTCEESGCASENQISQHARDALFDAFAAALDLVTEWASEEEELEALADRVVERVGRASNNG